MPTLKDELRRMAQVIGSRAGMPKNGNVIDIPLSNTERSYTAPCDGYLCIQAGLTTSEPTFLLQTSRGLNMSHWIPLSGSTVSVAMPAAKGQELAYKVVSGWVMFVKSVGAVGGGLKRLISNVFSWGRYGFA